MTDDPIPEVAEFRGAVCTPCRWACLPRGLAECTKYHGTRPCEICGEPTENGCVESDISLAALLRLRLKDALEAWRSIPPHDMVLSCPACGKQHLDIGVFETWAHRKHLCENTPEGEKTGCGHVWMPFPYATRGVLTDAPPAPDVGKAVELTKKLRGWFISMRRPVELPDGLNQASCLAQLQAILDALRDAQPAPAQPELTERLPPEWADRKFPEALKRACAEPTLAAALSWIAIWENDRAVKQALRGERDPNTQQLWDTCFLYCFQRVLEAYPVARAPLKPEELDALRDLMRDERRKVGTSNFDVADAMAAVEKHFGAGALAASPPLGETPHEAFSRHLEIASKSIGDFRKNAHDPHLAIALGQLWYALKAIERTP